MAISGAALSPNMGRLTRGEFRFLIALLNLGLGVWLPNPKHYARTLSKEVDRLNRQKRVRTASDTESIRARAAFRRRQLADLSWRYWTLARQGWREPGGWYVARQALGLGSLNDRFVYLADGGHWENLGLVELVRRRCKVVICFDASWSDAGPDTALAHAISLARAELGVEITPRIPKSETLGEQVPLLAEIVYPDGETGTLIYLRSVADEKLPHDVLAYARRDKSFPHTTTANQFYGDDRFEAYRVLGATLADIACTELDELGEDATGHH